MQYNWTRIYLYSLVFAAKSILLLGKKLQVTRDCFYDSCILRQNEAKFYSGFSLLHIIMATKIGWDAREKLKSFPAMMHELYKNFAILLLRQFTSSRAFYAIIFISE